MSKEPKPPRSWRYYLPYFLVAIVILTALAFLLYLFKGGGGNVPTPVAQDYFYLNGKKLTYSIIPNRVPIYTTSDEAIRSLSIREDIEVDTAFKFPGIAILESDQMNINSIDTTQQSSFFQNSSDLISLIDVDETNDKLIITDQGVAMFKKEYSREFIDNIMETKGCKIVDYSTVRPGRIIFECDTEPIVNVANYLHESGFTEFAHPDFIVELEIRSGFISNDPLFRNQWHLNNTGQNGGLANADVNAPEAWIITKGSPNVIIAIIDDAFDVRHEDLAANLHSQIDFSANPDDGDVFDRNQFHGTSVAGVAVAKGNNGIGVSGSCPECKFIAIRALSGKTSVQAAAFDHAVKSGAWIISNSWGYSTLTDDILRSIENAAVNGRGGLGCVILFAMTNERIDNCGRNPDISSLDKVIAISRSTNQDKLGGGGFGDCMELLAPTDGGTLGITTTDISGQYGYSGDNYYSDFGGTSSSTPLVAGIVGLMLSVNPKLSREQVREILITTADKIDSAQAKYNSKGFSRTHGYGRVNAKVAVEKSK